MNSLPASERGSGAGMSTTFQNSATVLSIGVFFSVITIGLASSLPSHLYVGLTSHGVPAAAARELSRLPPISVLFASFLGYSPIQHLLGPSGALAHLNAHQIAYLTGRSFFPSLISPPFGHGLHFAFDFAVICSVIAAAASVATRQEVHPRTGEAFNRDRRGIRQRSRTRLGTARDLLRRRWRIRQLSAS